MPRVAIVGSGPAGLFMADALSRSKPEVAVDVLERLDFPFGLVRYGVAPDHQGTKAVTRNLARVMERPNLRFFGGIEVGRELSLACLRELYDSVVIASGAATGRRLDFEGSNSSCSVTGFDLARWINCHPDSRNCPLPEGARTVAIIGHGNVALDVARLLVRPVADLEASDADRDFLTWRRRNRIGTIALCGRGTPADTRFSAEMLEELRDLPGVELLREELPAEKPWPEDSAVTAIIGKLPTAPSSATATVVRLLFGVTPQRFEGGELLLSRQNGPLSVPADLLVQAIGQQPALLEGLPCDPQSEAPLQREGAVDGLPGVFVLGWASGTARGTIPDSRATARALASRVHESALTRAAAGPERRDLASWLAARQLPFTCWEDWRRVDQLERELGIATGACRRKLRSLDELGASPSATP